MPYKDPEKAKINKKEYYAKNKEKMLLYRKQYHEEHVDEYRNWHLKKKYGITLEQKNQMVIDQQGLCGCCHKPLGINTRFICVDHSHKTDIIRKIICKNCNTVLGVMNEDPQMFLYLHEYAQYCNELDKQKMIRGIKNDDKINCN